MSSPCPIALAGIRREGGAGGGEGGREGGREAASEDRRVGGTLLDGHGRRKGHGHRPEKEPEEHSR